MYPIVDFCCGCCKDAFTANAFTATIAAHAFTAKQQPKLLQMLAPANYAAANYAACHCELMWPFSIFASAVKHAIRTFHASRLDTGASNAV
jgi:hypothetical protein